MDSSNIYYVFYTVPHENGELEKVLKGKFLLENGNFEVLENHGALDGVSALSPADASAYIFRLSHSMYTRVINLQDLLNGMHPEFLKDAVTKQAVDNDAKNLVQGEQPTPVTEFEYDRVGGEGPRILSVSDGQVFLDGFPLGEAEVAKVKQNVRGGAAFLRRKLSKAESIFNPGMERHLNEDSEVQGVGNLRAYNNFMQAPPPGLHIHLNMNDVRHLNATYGQSVGTHAVKAVGTSTRDVARTLIGQNARVFRLGGDRFVVHVPSTEAAALFARGLRQHLEQIPAINGTHKLSVTMGVGPSKEHANSALLDSMNERQRIGYPPGQSKTHVSIRIPGALEGPLPVD